MTDSDELQKVGLRFRDTFLSSGGGLKAAEVFRKFRGRDPSVNAYLEINGLSNIEKKSTKIVKEKGMFNLFHLSKTILFQTTKKYIFVLQNP